jgi:PPM family protein phosphatase
VKLEFAGGTSVGRRRKNNEDAWLVYGHQDVVAVADGMGGHDGGEVASQMTIEALRAFFKQTAPAEDNTWPHVASDLDVNLEDMNASRLVSAIQFAHRRIAYEVKRKPELDGMGTTVVCAHFTETSAYIAHVGDSRCYCFSGGHLRQVTMDHSLVNDMKKRVQKLTPEQERRLARLQHVVVRVLGGNDYGDVRVDLTILNPFVGDVFLLCSDGLTGELSDAEIKGILSAEPDLQLACQKLIDEANSAGGRDNVTVVMARVLDVEQPNMDDISEEATVTSTPIIEETVEEVKVNEETLTDFLSGDDLFEP